MNKQDRLRTLARKACEFVWSKRFGREAEAKAYTELRRFVDRNVDVSDLRDSLTFDDLGDFDVLSFDVNKAARTFKAKVNDEEYEGHFEIEARPDEPIDLTDFVVEDVEDQLLIAALEAKLKAHLDDEASWYEQDLEADLTDRAYEDYRDFLADRAEDERE